jgi:23S rRNA pseudouridine1911/1915/1917 synthase
MAQQKETIDEAFPGDIIGLYDTGNLKIGDTLNEGEKSLYKGIPSFSPELFKEVINLDAMKSKQLEKGLTQLMDEGVAQLFTYEMGTRKVVGTVGALQFEVLQYRLLNEYNAKVSFSPINIYRACWIDAADKNILEAFVKNKLIDPKIIYEDNHLLVINKPIGWLVQGDKTGDPTLTDWGKNYIKKKYNKPGDVFLNPAHRLDRPVSGVVIFARTSKALTRLTTLFRDQLIQKTYVAVVKARPQELNGTLINWLVKDETKNITKAFNKDKGSGKKSILTYRTLMYEDGHSLLLAKPETGRPHQIRVQLAKMLCPIQGDLKYGYATPNPDKSICLHAFKIEFDHPVKRVKISLRATPKGVYWKPYLNTINELDL